MTPKPVSSTTFPALAPDERAHSERVLAAVMAALQRNGGWLPFSEYQRLVLYGENLGYYTAGAVKLGAGGDFVTAPEISPLFGRCVARWIAPLLAAIGPDAEILELGAGSGALARDVLTELKSLGIGIAAYHIMEVSAELRTRQQASLGVSHAGTVRWLERLPQGFRGVVLANEVLDALPCERFIQQADGLQALGVGVDATGQLLDAARPPPAGVLADCYASFAKDLAAKGCELPIGYRGEFIPTLKPMIGSLADALQQGALVLIDYGLPRRQLYLPERSGGSLRCIRRHHAHDDPFKDPGLTDITCWVDWSAVVEAAQMHALEVRAVATQMAWLLSARLDTALDEAMQAATSEAERLRIANGVKTLILPGEMGEAVKMICLTRNLDPGLGTVAMQNLSEGM